MTGLNKPPTLLAETGHAPGKSADDDRALAVCDAAIRENPNSAAAYIKRSAIWMAKGEIKKAYADYHAARRLDRDLAVKSHDPAFTQALEGTMEEFEVLYRKLAES